VNAMTPFDWLLNAPFLVALYLCLCLLLAAGAAVASLWRHLWRHLRIKAEVRRGLRAMGQHDPAPNFYEHPGWPP
jgi:hypothetical protein